MAENFQLYNKDFINDFRELLKQLLASGDHSDITLVSDDLIPFKAHKLVICSQSIVLKKVVSFLPESNPLLFLRGINSKDISNLLTYLYVGQAKLITDDLKQLKIIAQSLSIKANFEVYEEDPKQGQIETHKKILDENGEDENVVFQKTVDRRRR